MGEIYIENSESFLPYGNDNLRNFKFSIPLKFQYSINPLLLVKWYF